MEGEEEEKLVFRGLILRDQLIMLLKNKVFFNESDGVSIGGEILNSSFCLFLCTNVIVVSTWSRVILTLPSICSPSHREWWTMQHSQWSTLATLTSSL